MDWMVDNPGDKPTRELVASWIESCWERTSEQICRNAFKGSGFMTAFGVREDETTTPPDESDHEMDMEEMANFLNGNDDDDDEMMGDDLAYL